MKRIVLAAVAVLALSGCETMSHDDCLKGDWAGVGFKDGQDGRPYARLADHAKACAATGVRPDEAAYIRGRDEGLRLYCTPRGGFDAGRKGHAYADVCPKPDEAFLRGFEDGRIVHDVQTAAASADSAVSSAQSREREKADDLRKVEGELRNPALNDEQKRELTDRRDRLADQRRDSARAARDAAERRDRAGYDLDRLHRDLTPIYGPW